MLNIQPKESDQKGVSMNKISGKIILDQSQLGLPNLLVVLYDLDPGTRPEEILARCAATDGQWLNDLGDRLGSVLTGPDGSFSLSYEDGELRIRNEKEKRPDLWLFVLGPQTPGKTLNELFLFASPEVRQNAGREESYFIQLTAEQLAKAGLPVPQIPTTPDGDTEEDDLAAFERKLESSKRVFDRKAAILQKHVEQEHQKHAQERATTFSVNVKEELSRVPKALRESRFFVADGESVHAKTFDNTLTQVQETFNNPDKKPVSTGFIYLTQAQITEYSKTFIQGDEFVLPGEVIERDILPQLFGGNSEDGSANDFLMNHPAVRLCTRVTRGDPSCKVDPKPPEDEPTSPDSGPILLKEADDPSLVLTKPDDVFPLIARQMEHVNAPEGIVNFGIEPKQRATASEIGERIGRLQFEKGPADIPAFFDFHKLNIAFEHVWKEALDQGILSQADVLYDQFVATGNRPIQLVPLVVQALSTLSYVNGQVQPKPEDLPVKVIFEFPDVVNVWDKMTPGERTALTKLTDIMLGKYVDSAGKADPTWKEFLSGDSTTVPPIQKDHLLDRGARDAIAFIGQKGLQIIDNVYERVEAGQELTTGLNSYQKAAELAESLNNKLQEPYSFTYFAADEVERSINFGVLLTYRQKWDPVNYQAGELVCTKPLAPKETCRYSKKTVVKKSRSQKEIEDNLRITKTDTSDTSRAESEIINKALNKSTFERATEASFNIPIGAAQLGGKVNTKNTSEATRESNQTKKDFRESVLKAAQEYKNERKVEITTEESYESEITESGEISNPNDELTVTYLFYELQRVFRIYERLHRMRPVILVAQEMPAPHEIDDVWIVRYEWILKRVLLDDGFLPAFTCIAHIRGDKLMLGELERTLLEQRKIVRDLRQNVKYYTNETGRMSRLMQAAINKEADIAEDRDIWDSIPLLGKRLNTVESVIEGVGNMFGVGDDDGPKEAARIRREGIKDAYERADRERRELMGRLEQETGVLNGLTKQVAEKRKEINEKEVSIAQLKNHLKDHILHYMQAIWSYEHPDQRFFRLYNTKVPQLTAPPKNYNLHINTHPAPAAMFDPVVNLDREGDQRKTRHAFSLLPLITVETKTLAEVAELDNLLGFKGNYAIFPLIKSNVLTDFMMAPYVDSEFGLLDPDAPGNWTLEEFDQLYCCLREELGDRFGEVEPALKEFYRQLLLDPLRQGELITVPTGSLFIEALPGEHPLLEDFKLMHRAVDVKKVQAEVRKMEMENIRYAARILADEREDPDVEKKIIVEGGQVPVVDS